MTHTGYASLETRGPGDSKSSGSAPGAGTDRSEEIAVIAHELRNSLAVIRSAARLLRAPALNGSIDNASQLIERHVVQMRRHIEDLLQPRRRSGPGNGLQFFHIDLRMVARHAADDIAADMAHRRHRLVIQLPEEPVWVHADGARLEQVFTNLLINAAKYTPDGGEVEFILEHHADKAVVRVRDSGIGIDAAKLPMVFGMFVQVGTALAGSECGRGIGLAVVRAVVEQHGGSVMASSRGLGLGSEFSVTLPTLRAQLDSVILTP